MDGGNVVLKIESMALGLTDTKKKTARNKNRKKCVHLLSLSNILWKYSN